MKKLKERWGIETNFQLTIVIIVFAITGSASAWLSRPLCLWLGLNPENLGFWYTPIRLLLIFPIYQILLVLLGFLFGQFSFFWNFEKKILKRMGFGFLFDKKQKP
jgi:hypothetical protein